MVPGICQWKFNTDGFFDTSCGEAFYWTNGGPTQNGFLFCPYCGDSLREVEVKEEEG